MDGEPHFGVENLEQLAGLMDSGMQPPDPNTLKALLSSLSLQRMGRPDEIAAAIALLASPAASYVTGAVLDAHGGYNAYTPTPAARPRRASRLRGAHRQRPAYTWTGLNKPGS
ncbi:SDR family oxidoreductase [Streptomyces sp. MH60]|uniref:SDR family oxidoreductase n=1 Tax=Streptomyces sp. MH60 TaxID=1940758 RepID=UPI00237A4EE7|nr:SDR family oxidoreductase [Streptomyces sp. MH60]